MKYKVFFPILASLMMGGALVMTSCSNDDENNAEPVETQDTALLLQQYKNTVATLNQEMAGLDFEELAPLATAMSEDTDADAIRQKFNAWLQQLLQLLNRDFKHTIPYGFTIGFEAVENVLSATWSLTGLHEFGQEGGLGWVENSDAMILSTSYKAQNGSEYLVILEERIDGDLKNLKLDFGNERILTIFKDGELLLSIRSSNENEAMVMSLLPTLTMKHVGEITYKGYVVSLNLSRAILHDKTIELAVTKDGGSLVKAKTNVTDNLTLSNILNHDAIFTAKYDLSLLSDMILINGKVNNINKLIAYMATFVILRQTGTTEEACNQFAQLFNENTSSSMAIAGSDVGNIIAASVFSDKLGKYVPSFLIYSPLFGDEPIDINTMLSNFGFSIEDILDIIKNKIG